MSDHNGKTVIQLGVWHAIGGLLAWLVIVIFFFANLQAQANETERRVKALEDKQPVTYQQMKDALIPLDERLKRIETKLDK
jgi:uncharacterized membrane protein YciS (DUF1049 family)